MTVPPVLGSTNSRIFYDLSVEERAGTTLKAVS